VTVDMNLRGYVDSFCALEILNKDRAVFVVCVFLLCPFR
jgi:hypothetical protein